MGLITHRDSDLSYIHHFLKLLYVFFIIKNKSKPCALLLRLLKCDTWCFSTKDEENTVARARRKCPPLGASPPHRCYPASVELGLSTH